VAFDPLLVERELPDRELVQIRRLDLVELLPNGRPASRDGTRRVIVEDLDRGVERARCHRIGVAKRTKGRRLLLDQRRSAGRTGSFVGADARAAPVTAFELLDQFTRILLAATGPHKVPIPAYVAFVRASRWAAADYPVSPGAISAHARRVSLKVVCASVMPSERSQG
jgi:hypothetical protein